MSARCRARSLLASVSIALAASSCGFALDTDSDVPATSMVADPGPAPAPVPMLPEDTVDSRPKDTGPDGEPTTTTVPAPSPAEIDQATIDSLGRDDTSGPFCRHGETAVASGAQLFRDGVDGVLLSDEYRQVAQRFVEALGESARLAPQLAETERQRLLDLFGQAGVDIGRLDQGDSVRLRLIDLFEAEPEGIDSLLRDLASCEALAPLLQGTPVDWILESLRNP